MSLLHLIFRRHAAHAVAIAASLVILSGCSGQTLVSVDGKSTGPYKIDLSVDPPTLAPPQTGTLTYHITDTRTGKVVKDFEQVAGALLHTVLISRDLDHFQHSYTERLVDERASVFMHYPVFSDYRAFSLFKPAGEPVQTGRVNITTSGAEGMEPDLVEDAANIKTEGWLTFQLLRSPEAITAGQPAQLVFHITERGRPVTALWPYLGAPGHLWVVDSTRESFAHLEAAPTAQTSYSATSASAAGTPNATPGSTSQAGTGDTAQGNNTGGGTGAGGVGQGGTRSGAEQPGTPQSVAYPTPPTFAPQISGALATITAAPIQQLAQVQQTAQSSILTTPEVLPSVGFGPDLVFTHTFPRAGVYKMWLEVEYRAQVVVANYVVRVR